MANTRIHIERMAYGGAGVAHYNDVSVFTPFTLSDEEVEVHLDQQKNGRWDATLLNVLQPSPDRVAPACVHFGICGGCHYQHAAYPAQLRIKQQILHDILTRGGITPPAQIIAHSAEPYNYRNRIQLRLEKQDNRWHIGYSQRGTHRFMPATMCPISAESLWQVAQALEALLNKGHVLAQQPLREVELFCNADGSQLQLSIYLDTTHSNIDRDAPSHFRKLCEALRLMHPQLTGAGLWVWSTETLQKNGRPQHRTSIEVAAWGEPTLHYNVQNRTYEIARGGFFQVNRWMLPSLLKLVTSHKRAQTAWDLFAGVGLFSSALAQHFDTVVAVEIGERSFAGLRTTMQHLGKRHTAIHKDTLAFFNQDARKLTTPDLIIVDPPRAGLGRPVTQALAQIGASEIVYVSCDPTTLSSDLKGLIESGYYLAELHLVDLFPQTFHMESVAKLKRV